MVIPPSPFDPAKEGKDITDKQMFDYSEKYLEKMGLGGHQAVMAVHRDTEHPHVHIVFNRVNDEGLAWSTSNNFYRSKEAIAEVSKEIGYDVVQKSQEIQQTRDQMERVFRGELDWKMEIRSRVDQSLVHSNGTWDDFKQKCAEKNLEIKNMVRAYRTG